MMRNGVDALTARGVTVVSIIAGSHVVVDSSFRGQFFRSSTVQRDDDVTAVLAGAQASSGRDDAFLLRQHGQGPGQAAISSASIPDVTPPSGRSPVLPGPRKEASRA
jgi:hypothetical protein